MNNLLKILEWDSNFFGYPVGKIIAENISIEQLNILVCDAKKRKIRLLYIITDPVDLLSIDALNKINARLVDQKITYHMNIDQSVISTVDSHIEQFESNYPTQQLINLSLQSGLYSRYKIDPAFRNNEFEKLYLAWIENSVNKKMADYTLIYNEKGNELGFVTLKISDHSAQIGLIAVDESSRGKSIGKKLVTAVINLLLQKNITELEVATQLANTDACNFYKKIGFTGSKTENIYHIWF